MSGGNAVWAGAGRDGPEPTLPKRTVVPGPVTEPGRAPQSGGLWNAQRVLLHRGGGGGWTPLTQVGTRRGAVAAPLLARGWDPHAGAGTGRLTFGARRFGTCDNGAAAPEAEEEPGFLRRDGRTRAAEEAEASRSGGESGEANTFQSYSEHRAGARSSRARLRHMDCTPPPPRRRRLRRSATRRSDGTERRNTPAATSPGPRHLPSPGAGRRRSEWSARERVSEHGAES